MPTDPPKPQDQPCRPVVFYRSETGKHLIRQHSHSEEQTSRPNRKYSYIAESQPCKNCGEDRYQKQHSQLQDNSELHRPYPTPSSNRSSRDQGQHSSLSQTACQTAGVMIKSLGRVNVAIQTCGLEKTSQSFERRWTRTATTRLIGNDEIFSESSPFPGHAPLMYQTLGNGESVNRRDGLNRSPADALQTIKTHITSNWPVPNFASVTVLVGVSGGADSVCLLRALHDLMPPDAVGRLVVAHYNHQLRGEDADSDARFVRELAGELGLHFELGTPAISPERNSPLHKDEPPKSEESLRIQRYAFFEDAAARNGARYLALAHTASDNVETVLHNLFRGTGPAGLEGIPKFRNLGSELVIARPMLTVDRQMVVDCLRQLGQTYCHDHTNDEDFWSRNWLRNQLLPLIRKRYPHADSAILRASELISQQNGDLERLAQHFIDQSVQLISNGLSFRKSPPEADVPASVFVSAVTILWDQMQWGRGNMSRRHWEDLWNLYCASKQSPDDSFVSINLPGGLRATHKADGTVVVERVHGD